MSQTNAIGLLFFRLVAGPLRHHDQDEDGQTHEPEARSAIGGISELDEVVKPSNQERHTGHHGIAEGRAKRDHQKEDASPGHNLA